ncbi:hypothetical protein GN316_10370 [Xylophilus sp. Kf1]|nr:hypothetical protein [Xylophilus sp. Kf1]
MHRSPPPFPDHVVVYASNGSQGAVLAAQAMLNQPAGAYQLSLHGRHEHSHHGYARVKCGALSIDMGDGSPVLRRHGTMAIDARRTLVIDPGTVASLADSIARTPVGCHVAYSQNGIPSHEREKAGRRLHRHTLVSRITSTRQYGHGITVEPGGVLLIDESDIHLETFARIFRDRGFFRLQAVPDIRAAQHEKIAINCALNVSATVRCLSLGELRACALADPAIRHELEGLALEAWRVSAAQGIRMAPRDDLLAALYALMAANPRHPTSMRRAFEAGAPTEIGVLNAAIVRLGSRWGVATPLNRRMVARLAEMEARRDRQAWRVSPGRDECRAA